ncbi:hypothetical protein H6G20_19130 [Desertifilum sp. FACHB-1129]|uniref:Uncharacterized protein n=1 Tax=Desertifilum tharense IPPAS B-1220 TaxID=1781255 RepID=A0A1E5QLJ2_9CYAN|nr:MULTISPECIES: hypothetical protein [Desertifilum]MCD8489687.1 hypothetical protein [Desertifilum sp.]MDA0209947.1 hypothetical protein [Cyanobacteria bacterium FC1]MBD2313785.1 hypothetical protein [Desertifilum sp. FACHB-1129]MBD2324504.1 hypothetical protein [Desertifilum sp. FACHB-866]MBD2334518.1 hypothetical protein [Desertifilum sp. FACHB-868]
MLDELFPFKIAIDATAIAGTSLWSLALYLGFSPVSDWLMEQMSRWFNFAERALYTSSEEYERTRRGREAQNSFYASIFSIIPFLAVGAFCNYLVEIGLDRSWAISIGLLACVGGGVYELGRRDGQS